MDAMSKFFHYCKWAETERFYAKKLWTGNVSNASKELVERLTFGVTTILYNCSECNAPKSIEILGEKEVSDE